MHPIRVPAVRGVIQHGEMQSRLPTANITRCYRIFLDTTRSSSSISPRSYYFRGADHITTLITACCFKTQRARRSDEEKRWCPKLHQPTQRCQWSQATQNAWISALAAVASDLRSNTSVAHNASGHLGGLEGASPPRARDVFFTLTTHQRLYGNMRPRGLLRKHTGIRKTL